MFFLKKDKKKEIFTENKENLPQPGNGATFFSAIIDYFADGLLVFDKENKVSLVNPQAEKFLGISKDNLLGKPILRLNSFPSLSPLVSLLGGEIREIFRNEAELNKNIILEVSSISLKSNSQKIGTLVVLHDITREKLVETMKGEFVTVAAHQMRTPTSAVKWSLRMLLDGDLGDISEEQKRVIEKTYQTNEKVIRLVGDLLNVARIEGGSFLSEVALSNLEETAQSVFDSRAYDVKKKKIKFDFKRSGNLSEVMIDKAKMKIAIENIFDNAIKYTPVGGKIKFSIQEKEKELEAQVQDTGIGIPQDKQERIFEKFFRAENAVKVEPEGNGLGLFISKYIIEAHGGKIWFKSKEGEGAIFYFTIPKKREFAEYLTDRFY